jgi:hypothetical protein
VERGCNRQQHRISEDEYSDQTEPCEQTVKQYLKEPAIGGPGFTHRRPREEIGVDHRSVLDDPFTGAKVPPEISIKHVNCCQD